jgi:hypothetical protein
LCDRNDDWTALVSNGAGVAKWSRREMERAGVALGTRAGSVIEAVELHPRGGDARAGDESLTASAPVSFVSVEIRR